MKYNYTTMTEKRFNKTIKEQSFIFFNKGLEPSDIFNDIHNHNLVQKASERTLFRYHQEWQRLGELRRLDNKLNEVLSKISDRNGVDEDCERYIKQVEGAVSQCQQILTVVKVKEKHRLHKQERFEGKIKLEVDELHGEIQEFIAKYST